MTALEDVRWVLCPVCRSEDARHLGAEEFDCPNGCDSEQIYSRLRETPTAEWAPAAPIEAVRSSWQPVDLGPILSGSHTDEPPEILGRNDGVRLLYRGRLHSVSAEPEACKGWLACTASAERLAAAENTLCIDYEDTAASHVSRHRALGVDDVTIGLRYHYVRPEEPLRAEALERLLALRPELVVIDGVTEALAVEGLDLASNQDVATFYNRVARPFARAGAAVLLVDHVTKDRETRGRYAIGAQHKLAGVDVAYKLDVAQPFGRGREGLVKVTVTKDRPGFVRQHAADRERIALMRLRSLPDGGVTVTLEPPEDNSGASFRPTVLMERVSRAVEEEPGLTRRALRTAVKGRHDAKELALEILVAEGYVEARRDGQWPTHHSTRPYRADTPTGPMAPNRPQNQLGPLAPLAPSLKGQGPGTTTDLDRADRLLGDHSDIAEEAA